MLEPTTPNMPPEASEDASGHTLYVLGFREGGTVSLTVYEDETSVTAELSDAQAEMLGEQLRARPRYSHPDASEGMPEAGGGSVNGVGLGVRAGNGLIRFPVREGHATAGIDIVSVRPAPGRELVGVNVHLQNFDRAAALELFDCLLRAYEPLGIRLGELSAVFE
jgi:hypothetical protein